MIVDACAKSGDWKADVKAFARQEYKGPLLDGPIELSIIFYMPRPKNHFGTGKKAGILKANAPQWHTTKPDRTKLTRGLEDSLTGVIWRDDSQVVCGDIRKVYGSLPGARIIVRQI